MTARMLRGLAAATLLVAVASPLAAQRQKEIRLDMISFITNDGNSITQVGFPSTTSTVLVPQLPAGLAFGVYMNKNIAIEPSIAVLALSGGGSSQTAWGLGVAVPYYFKGDFGKTGWFVAPGLSYTDLDTGGDAIFGYGADVGMKFTWKDMVSWRVAAFVADNDVPATEMSFGARFGVGVRWK